MQQSDRNEFMALMSGVTSFYRQDFSPFAAGVWWEAMKPFDLPAVSDALNRHAVNPDNGQFMPKPADVVRLLRGSTQDSALVAWAKVDGAIRVVGPYRSVAFDDPLIHAVVADMGGWIALSKKDDDEWPFVAKEFENRYRGALRSPGASYPKHLVGLAEQHNAIEGKAVEPPLLLGDPVKAQRVLAGGSEGGRLRITEHLVSALPEAVRV